MFYNAILSAKMLHFTNHLKTLVKILVLRHTTNNTLCSCVASHKVIQNTTFSINIFEKVPSNNLLIIHPFSSYQFDLSDTFDL